MPLETTTYINGLVVTNPAATDGVNQGDDHVRLIKSTLLNTFPNFGAVALNSTQAQLDAAVNLLTGVSGVAAFPAGSVSAPSISFTGDSNTGIYHPAADQLAVALNGVQQLLLTTTAATVVQPLTAATVTSTGAYSGGTGQLVPTGAIFAGLYPGGAPSGYLLLNGTAVSRTGANAALFALWGTTYGAGDGATTFNLPNFQEVTPVGQSTMGGASSPGRMVATANRTTLGGVAGEEKHTLVLAEAPTGQFTFNDVTHTHTASSNIPGLGTPGGFNGGNAGSFGQSTQTITVNAAATGCSITDHAGGGSHNNVQPTIFVQWIVKT